jgi:hypothetical protein
LPEQVEIMVLLAGLAVARSIPRTARKHLAAARLVRLLVLVEMAARQRVRALAQQAEAVAVGRLAERPREQQARAAVAELAVQAQRQR